jgi:alkylation response protein AidB-like acyl-CoA dehydrogenase
VSRAAGAPCTTPAELAALATDFATRAAEHDRTASFPFENFERLHAAGLLGLTIASELGGRGAGLLEASRVVRAIAAGDSSTALVLAMHYIQHGVQFRGRIWPRRAYERVVREALESGALINSLQTEPEQGALGRGGLPATVAEPAPGGWRLNGRKAYVTGIPILRWLSVWARTTDAAPRMGTWLVPRDAPGIEVIETWDHLGMRATASHDVVLRDVVVPEDYALDVRLPEEWAGQHPATVSWVAVLLSALYLGVAEAARDWLVGWLRERSPSNLGRPLASLERFQDAVGEIEALLYAAGRLLEDAAAAADADAERPSIVQSGLVKLTVTGNAIRAVERAVELAGNPGLSRGHTLERHYRDVLCSRVHWPQDDAILRRAGRAVLGT